MLRLELLTTLGLLSLAAAFAAQPAVAADPAKSQHEATMQLFRDGNLKEAFDELRKLTLVPTTPGDRVAEELDAAVNCLRQLNRLNEVDDYREAVATAHADDWRVVAAVANSYQTVDHYGGMIGGKFERGPQRGQARIVHATSRDRVRALQLYLKAMHLAEKSNNKADAAGMLRQFADALLAAGYGHEAWRLQSITDLDTLPDYEDGWGYGGNEAKGAPVDDAGNPIYYSVPASWDAAKNDGERWRFVLNTMVDWQPTRRNEERIARANFLESQFGVQTMAMFPFGPWSRTDEDQKDRPKTWALDTLTETETIAKLATGIKRFTLPDDQNFIKLYQQVIEDTPAAERSGPLQEAILHLGSDFENRRQFPRAAEYWKMGVERLTDPEKQLYQQRLNQITGNWGQFEGVMTQPAGRGASVDFRFRNAKQIEFTAQKIDVQKLLADVKAYIKSKPKELDWQKLNVEEIGSRLVQEKQKQYVGEEVARWNLTLEPRDKHFDKRITVTTPLQKSGAYLVTAKIGDGNTCQIVMWLADAAIVRKPMPDKSFYFVADAVTGKPLAKANVEFFGYRQRNLDNTRFEIDVKNFSNYTDAEGQVLLPIENDKNGGYQWLATATTPDGRLAYMGFHNVWIAGNYDQQYNDTKVFTITDRPVYRPLQTVEFKVWIAHAQYDEGETSEFAHQSFQIEVYNPKAEKIYTETLTADNFGGMAGKLELPADATLGQYELRVVNHGSGNFRVEEYKKPEFEVTVEAPKEPVTLGDKITATIHAKYYFGSPVTNATVKYKVIRTSHDGRWFPVATWDWLYGPGYWWFSYDYAWYPGWRDWGCPRPRGWWYWKPSPPPEIVAEREAPIGPDGTLQVEIDTSLAQAVHPDTDHRYEIQAEVVDDSRRTIVGSGAVLVARKPFQVYAWVDNGYYRVGDTITASFAARQLDGRGVEGTGKLKLLKISYNADKNNEPIETEVRDWDLPTNDEGHSELQIKASEKGQYRLSYSVTDKAGHTIEGAYVFTIVGEGFDGNDFRFSDIELVPDKREYAPNDKVQLQVNTNRIGATVLLFIRPANGIYLVPQTLHLKGKSTIVPLEVTAKDMPNFFVEAVTVSYGRVHTDVREIFVPPAKRILNVDVVPSSDAYQPGQHAVVKLKVTDDKGQPFVGSTVLSIFDKSVEYISGGSNVADIKAFFWKWRRQHRPFNQSNLDRFCQNLTAPDQTPMQTIGVFGGTMDEDDVNGLETNRPGAGMNFFGGRGGGMAGGSRRLSVMSANGGAAFGMPAAAPMGMLADKSEVANYDRFESKTTPSESEPLVNPTIRSEFADTALWVASLDTNADGLAQVELDMPQNLTTWKIKVWAMGHGTRVGEAASEVVTRKNIIVRMQAPRFFVERDEVVLTANVHNYLPDAKKVKVRLEQDGDEIELPANVEQTVEVPAGGEKRVDWRVKVRHEGEATLRMLALTDAESDAVQMKLPVEVHGMLKTDSYTGSLRPADDQGSFEVTVPAERRAEQTRLEVRYSPTLAGAMVDALPYLIDYPYGCTEQTLNRFLPAVITQKALTRMGLNLKAIEEKRTNLNAQEIGDDAKRAKGWKRFDRNPVFDEAELTTIVKSSVQRLTDMQLTDGGWGWFSGYGEQSTPHTTAVVVHGLTIAKENDVALVPGVLERGVAWLEHYQDDQIAALKNVDDAGKVIDKNKPAKYAADNLDALVYMVLVDADVHSDAMRDFLYRDRTKLAVYSLATYGIALQKQHEADKLAMVMRNIRQYVVEDAENQTAHLNMPGENWWYWYGSEFEAYAYYLKLLVAADPKDPLAPKLVKFLVNNRKHATYWNSTRDTALVIEALADYIKATGEDKPDLTIEVWIDGQKRKEVKVDAENLFTFDNKFVLTGDALEPGRHTIEIRKRGTGPLYYNGYLTNFTLEDDIKRAGLELKVERHYYKLTPADKTVDTAGGHGQVVSQKVEKYDRTEIPNLGTVQSGDQIEIELVIDSKNDYEYILFEDMKAAGCEPVDLQSGYNGNDIGAYMELRDNRVSFFVQQLARGKRSVSYRMRAEIPGRFSALPTRASAMYAPELRGNSDELKLNIDERAAKND